MSMMTAGSGAMDYYVQVLPPFVHTLSRNLLVVVQVQKYLACSFRVI